MNRKKGGDREIWSIAGFDKVYTDNVKDFCEHAWQHVSEIYKSHFIGLTEACVDDHATTPIEALFYIAYKATLEKTKIMRLSKNGFISDRQQTLWAQYEIGKYRCDFLLYESEKIKNIDEVENAKDIKKLIIELDGHDFHDKNEKQRRYEKERDRFLQSKGFTVYHFTGKEVTDNPMKVVAKCLASPNHMEDAWYYGGCYGEEI